MANGDGLHEDAARTGPRPCRGPAHRRRRISSRPTTYELLKRSIDVVGSLVLLVLSAPLSLVAALLVLVTMGRPVLHRARRVGRDERLFELVKFRSMRPLRPGETVPDSDAARLTILGRFLRRSSIDELPSLVNVLRGEMSLVGPRPLPPHYLDRYTAVQRRRHEVKPGITGWAQVHGRNSLSWSEKFAYDVWYVDHASLRLDVRILLKTLPLLVVGAGVAHEGHASMPEFTGHPERRDEADDDRPRQRDRRDEAAD